jgi:DNA helicase-2/ATP-dependent DNA helicase PcrA
LSWQRLKSGKHLTVHEAKNIIKFFSFTVDLPKKESYDLNDLGLPDEAKNLDWMTMLKGIAPDEREYLRSCLRNGEKFSNKPRISISTIHQSKGGEADNVVLTTDMGRLSWENSHTDEENRVWYVALTRAKENLFVVRPRNLMHYQL